METLLQKAQSEFKKRVVETGRPLETRKTSKGQAHGQVLFEASESNAEKKATG